MKQISIGFLFLILFACKSHNNEGSKASIKDSLLGKFLNISDSLLGIDTLDYNRKLLVAYHNNDTHYLRMAVEEIQNLLRFRNEMSSITSCPEPPDINYYKFKEAYRFEYRTSFCDQSINITVGERNDSILMFVYHYNLVNNTDSCLSYKNIQKSLTAKQWDTLKQYALLSDFWWLKPQSDRYGFDGSDLTVTGYQMPVNSFQGRYNKVNRWSAEKMALGKFFIKVLEFTEIKLTCFEISKN